MRFAVRSGADAEARALAERELRAAWGDLCGAYFSQAITERLASLGSPADPLAFGAAVCSLALGTALVIMPMPPGSRAEPLAGRRRALCSCELLSALGGALERATTEVAMCMIGGALFLLCECERGERRLHRCRAGRASRRRGGELRERAGACAPAVGCGADAGRAGARDSAGVPAELWARVCGRGRCGAPVGGWMWVGEVGEVGVGG